MSKDSSSKTKKASKKQPSKKKPEPSVRSIPTAWKVGQALQVSVAVLWGFIAVQFLISTVVISLLKVTLGGQYDLEIARNSVWLYSLVIVCVQLGTAAAAYYAIRFVSEEKNVLKHLGLLLPKKGLFDALVAIPGVAFLLFLVTLSIVTSVVDALIPAVDIHQSQNLAFDSPEGFTSLALIFMSLVILTPIAEEIVFRGLLFKQLRRYLPAGWAIAISAVVFGLIHAEVLNGSKFNWAAVIDVGIFAVFLGYVYERTNVLWTPIVLHGMKNALAFYVLFII